MRRQNPLLAMVLSIFAALILTMLPLPQELSYWRPEWLLMVLVFWVLNEPQWFGIWMGFLLGLLLDVLLATPFGLHAMMLATVAYLTRLSYRWVRVFSIWQTGGLVFALVLAAFVIKLLLLNIVGRPPGSLLFWLPALSSFLVWPTVMLVLRPWNRRF